MDDWALLFYRPVLQFCKSIRRRCSVKKGVLKNFVNFTGKHLCWSLRWFPVKFTKFLRTPILKNICKTSVSGFMSLSEFICFYVAKWRKSLMKLFPSGISTRHFCFLPLYTATLQEWFVVLRLNRLAHYYPANFCLLRVNERNTSVSIVDFEHVFVRWETVRWDWTHITLEHVALIESIKRSTQRRIQESCKHLRWRALQQ